MELQKFVFVYMCNIFSLFGLMQKLTFAAVRDGKCATVEIVSRQEWRARPPNIRRVQRKLPVPKVIISHTVSPTCKTKPQCIREVQFIQDYHLDYRGWNDIAHNFLIGGDGRVYEGVGWTGVGSHTTNFNTMSVCIAFIGDFSDVAPSRKMIRAAADLIECGVQLGFLLPTSEIHGQRDVVCTLSPGDKLYAIIRMWKNYIGGRLSDYDCRNPSSLN